MPLIILLILFILSLLSTAFIRQYALMNNVLDIPNHRSSHIIPTPRGGGLAFVVLFLSYIACLGYVDPLPGWVQLGLTAGGCGAAFLGLMDDYTSIDAKYRLLGHFIISAFVLYCLGGMSSLTIFGLTFKAGSLIVNIFALLYLVWFLNLYNFMDGIDGLASIEAVFVCFSGALFQILNMQHLIFSLPIVLATLVAGFLVWNFPRARVFMGDVGSCFLGLMIGIFSIQASWAKPSLFWSWLILAGIFIVDATSTLFFRAIEGRTLYEAHRAHAYQRATDYFNSHVTVTFGILLINIIWLLPIAYAVAKNHLPGYLGLTIAYIPLFFLVIYFRIQSVKSSTF